MLPLIPLALQLAPTLASWLFGPKGGDAAKAVTGAIQQVTGSADPAEAELALSKNPELAVQLKIELAKIEAQAAADQRAADQAAIAAQLADVASARGQTVALAQAKSPMQWAAGVVSLVVTVGFFMVMWLLLTGRTAGMTAQQETAATLLLGTLTTGFGAVIQFWLGSSLGSRSKDGTIAQQSQALAVSSPPGR